MYKLKVCATPTIILSPLDGGSPPIGYDAVNDFVYVEVYGSSFLRGYAGVGSGSSSSAGRAGFGVVVLGEPLASPFFPLNKSFCIKVSWKQVSGMKLRVVEWNDGLMHQVSESESSNFSHCSKSGVECAVNTLHYNTVL